MTGQVAQNLFASSSSAGASANHRSGLLVRQGSSKPASGAVSIRVATPAPESSDSVDNVPFMGTVAVNIRWTPVKGLAWGLFVVRTAKRVGTARRPRIRLRVRGLRELRGL